MKQARKETAKAARAKAANVKKVARKTQETIQRSREDATQGAQRTADQLASVSVVAAQQTRDGAEQLNNDFDAMTKSGAGLVRGYEAVSREWMDMSQHRLRKNMDGLNALMGCRSIPELVAAQSSLIRENLDLNLKNGRRLAELSTKVGAQAAQSLTVTPERKATPASRAS